MTNLVLTEPRHQPCNSKLLISFCKVAEEHAVIRQRIHRIACGESTGSLGVRSIDLLVQVCVPVGSWVTDEQREHVVATIRKGW